MKLGLFVPTWRRNYNKVPASVWIRVLQMIKYYKAFGVKVYLNNLFTRYDFSIVYRASNTYVFNFIKFLKKISDKVYWDTCVNYYELHPYTNKSQVEITKKITSFVDGVIVSTEEIAKRAALYNDSVFVMDDPIDFNHFKYLKKVDLNGKVVFGWSGISEKAVFLNKYADYFNKDNFIVISDRRPKLRFDFRFYEWRYESFPFLLSQVDVAFLPRKYDDSYNLCHSSFKALVFAAQGIPIIANALPSYKKLSKYYDSIVFLEDFSFEDALLELKTRNFSIDKLKSYYSCENQAKRLLQFLGVLE